MFRSMFLFFMRWTFKIFPFVGVWYLKWYEKRVSEEEYNKLFIRESSAPENYGETK